jgi:ribokinase
MRVVNFGSLNIDYTYRVENLLRPGETKAAKSLAINCGGKGLNQSVALARAGACVYHASFVGPEGTFLVETLRESGADVQFIQTVPQSCGHAIIQVSDTGENCILIHPGTNGLLTMPYVKQVLSHFSSGDVVLLQNETNLVGQIMEAAVQRGMLVAFNAAPMDEKTSSYPLDKLKWLFVNETEGAALSGQTDYDTIAAALRNRFSHTNIVLTLGEEGCLYAGEEGYFRVPAFPVQAVDTTAAGDTFTGFFLRAVLDGQGPQEALTLAARASAIAVTRPGAANSIPRWEEVHSQMAV